MSKKSVLIDGVTYIREDLAMHYTDKKVSVELSLQDVMFWASYNLDYVEKQDMTTPYGIASMNFYNACHKALKELK